MEWLLLVLVVVIVAAAVLNNRLSGLQRRIAELEGLVRRLSDELERLGQGKPEPAPQPRAKAQQATAPTKSEPVEIPSELKPAAAVAPAAAVDEPVDIPSELPPAPKVPGRKPVWPRPDQVAAEAAAGGGTGGRAEPPPRQPEPPRPPKPREPVDWEKTLGVRLPVWGGAIMLVIAGFFLINWAIESGAYLFTPEVRVGLCALAAAGLLAAAYVVKARGIANGERIASALAAAAIAVGYGTMYLATAVFHLVPDVVALAGAAVLAIVAVGIASQFGQRVMLVGLLGGYVAPLFALSPATTSTVLNIYVMVLLAVSVFAIRLNGWWGQTIPAIAAPTLWALVLAFGSDTLMLALLYLLLAALPAAAALLPLRGDGEALAQRLRLVTAGFVAAALCLAVGGYLKDYAPAMLVVLALVGAGGAALLVRHREPLRLGWIATLVAGLFALVSWEGADQGTLLLFALVLAVVHLGALALQFRAGAERARRAFEIAALSVLLFVILLVKLDGWIGAHDVPYTWAALALAVAAAFGVLALRYRGQGEGNGPSAGFAAGTSAFLSLSLGLVLDPGLYALTAALQAFGLALLYLRYRAPVLKQMHIGYVVLYAVLVLIGQVQSIDRLLGSAARLSGWEDFIPAIGMNEAPLTLLLVPGLLLVGASTALARVAYSAWPRLLDVVSVLLVALAVHFLVLGDRPRLLLDHPLTLGSWWFNGVALVALAATFAAWKTGRTELLRAGVGVGVITGFVMALAIMLPVFRFWPRMDVPGAPVLNVALTGIGLPSIQLLAIAWLARRQGWLQFARGFAAFGGLGGLVTILVVIRQAIHGPTLQGPGLVSGQVELYSYSLGMLAYGFALLWAGAAFSSLALRVGSLVVVLATVGKVFFYDVGGLEGLWRVGSFLGLGLALLVVSWFYGRFVFGIGPGGTKRRAEGDTAAV